MFQIQVHGDDWISFYEQVPNEVLPVEYGGKAGTVAEHIKTKMIFFKFTAGSFNCVKQMNLNILLNSINGKRNGTLHHRSNIC